MMESIYQENMTTLEVYASNNGSSKYMKENLIKLQGQIDKS